MAITASSSLAPHLERPPPSVLPVGSSSDDSISTVATESSTDTFPLPFSNVHHPYSSLVYTPPARQKDQYIDDEELLSRRFDGLGIRERAAAELSAKVHSGYAGQLAEGPELPLKGGGGAAEDSVYSPPSFSTFAFPPSQYSAPPRHTSLPAIVTAANQIAGLSASSPIDPTLASFPRSTASLTGSAISLTPDVSPGQSPTLSSSSVYYPSTSSLPPRHQPFHQRSATTSSSPGPSCSSTSPLAATTSGMARSGSTPNGVFTSLSSSSSSSCSPSFLQSPIARSSSSSSSSTSYVPPWAASAGASVGTRPGSSGTSSTNRTNASSSTGSGSTRPWVFDSDASSVCSANSGGGGGGGGGWSSGGGGGVSSMKTRGEFKGKQSAELIREGDGNGKPRERRMTEDGEEFEVDEGGEVFKPESDVEFLDHRPEPPGAKLSINRDDPHQVVLKVTLPGFSLDNITVAMRRGHKVHIVADSYDKETGGHFEKLIRLGSDVSSVAPRAEFNGTDLNVYIQRRPSRPSSSTSTAGSSTAALPPFGMTGSSTAPGSPSSMFSSPELDFRRPSVASSFASAWSFSDSSSQHGHPLSPSLDYASPTSSSSYVTDDPSGRRRRISEDALPPPCTVVAPPMNLHDAESRKSKSRSLTGPEGAKAAAKAAREEAARRAKEEAKKLPTSAKGGRRLPFRRPKEDGTFSASSGSNGEGSAGEGSSSASASDDGLVRAAVNIVKKEPEERATSGRGIDRNGTIKANSRSNSPLPPVTPTEDQPLASSSSSLSSSVSSSSASSVVSSPTSSPPKHEPRPLPLFTNPSNPHHTHPRPKLREGNLTLRAADGQSFVAQAQAQHSQWPSHPRSHPTGAPRGGTSGNESEVEGEGDSLTPRWEEKGMKFTTATSSPST